MSMLHQYRKLKYNENGGVISNGENIEMKISAAKMAINESYRRNESRRENAAGA
jgi:hypothetical protein